MATPKRRLSRYGFPAALAVAFALFGSLPYCYGYLHAGEGMKFMGFVGRGVFGLNGYLMLARQSEHGLHLFENLSTSEALPRVFFNLEWWLFGKMARWTGLPLIAVFHVWRIATVFLFVFSVHYLSGLCLKSEFQRRFALALVTFGSGFGWVLWAGSKVAVALFPPARAWAADQVVGLIAFKDQLFPLSIDVAGVSAPAYLVNQPHFMRATAFAALTWAFVLAGERSGRRVYFALSGIAALLHIALRPYNIAETYLVYLLFPVLMSARERRVDFQRFKNCAIAASFLLPITAYYGYLAYVDALGGKGPNWRPGLLLEHILWLGLPFLLMVLCVPWLSRWRTARPSSMLIGLWLVVAFLVEQAYPYWRTGQEAAFAAYVVVPALLATAGPFRGVYHALRDSAFARKLSRFDLSSPAFKRAVAVAVVLFCMPSFGIAYARMFADLRDSPPPYYIRDGLYDSLVWLRENAGTHDTVLASFETGQLVPRVAGVKTYLAHYMITKDCAGKRAHVRRFFSRRGDDEFKQHLVMDNAIRYVVLGPLERHPGGMQPADHPWLEQRWSQEGVAIYAVGGQGARRQ